MARWRALKSGYLFLQDANFDSAIERKVWVEVMYNIELGKMKLEISEQKGAPPSISLIVKPRSVTFNFTDCSPGFVVGLSNKVLDIVLLSKEEEVVPEWQSLFKSAKSPLNRYAVQVVHRGQELYGLLMVSQKTVIVRIATYPPYGTYSGNVISSAVTGVLLSVEDLLQIEFTVGPVKIATSRLLELYQHLLIAFDPGTTSGSLRLTGYDPDRIAGPSSPNLPTKRSTCTDHLTATNSKGMRAPLPLPKPPRSRLDAKTERPDCLDPAVTEPCYSVVNRERVRRAESVRRSCTEDDSPPPIPDKNAALMEELRLDYVNLWDCERNEAEEIYSSVIRNVIDDII